MRKFKLRMIGVLVAVVCTLMTIVLTSFNVNSNKTSKKTPNLVFILVDDLGYGDLASYGHQIVKTPNIDKLVRDGIKYTQYYAPSPLCSPSRAGLLTGRTPYRTGIRSWIPAGSNIHIGNNEITLAHLLKGKGYETAVMGKWHLNGGPEMTDQPQAKEMGFDYSFIIPGGWVKNKRVETKPTDGTLRHGKMYPDNFWRNGKPVGDTEKFSGELVSEEVSSWLNNHKKGNPFFLYVPFSEVHTPIASPKKYLQMYSDYIPESAKNNPDLYHWDWVDQPYRGQGEYYANISFVDAQVGKIMDKLEKLGELNNTIVILTSDNGPVTREARKQWELNMAGETGGLRGRKDNLFEGGIRVPAIVRYPEMIKPGQISHTPVYGLDWLPTLAELMNFEVPADRAIDGQSIVKTMQGKEIDRVRPMIWTIDMEGQDDPINEWAIRDGEWLLILDRGEKPKFLFNIANDPYEVVNLLHSRDSILIPLLEKFNRYKNNIETDSINVTAK